MPHMVIFRSVEGKPGYHQAETLDDAVRFVERLRNQEQVSDMRVFRMQEVPIEFRTYFRVEVLDEQGAAAAPAAAGAAPAAPVAPAAPAASAEEKPPVAEEAPAAVSAPVNAEPAMAAQGQGAPRFGRFNRG